MFAKLFQQLLNLILSKMGLQQAPTTTREERTHTEAKADQDIRDEATKLVNEGNLEELRKRLS